MNNQLISRFSIWDKNEVVLFDTDSYQELINEIGTFESPLRRVGDTIKIGDGERKISNIFFGVSEYEQANSKLQLVIEVE